MLNNPSIPCVFSFGNQHQRTVETDNYPSLPRLTMTRWRDFANRAEYEIYF